MYMLFMDIYPYMDMETGEKKRLTNHRRKYREKGGKTTTTTIYIFDMIAIENHHWKYAAQHGKYGNCYNKNQ